MPYGHINAHPPNTRCPLPAQVQAEGRRNKVPLEKGFSQVDWIKLSRSGKDLRCECLFGKDLRLSVKALCRGRLRACSCRQVAAAARHV